MNLTLRKRSAMWWGASILMLAAALRLPNVVATYPYMAYVDEGNYLWVSRDLCATGGWDPKNYLYPTLPHYLACAAGVAADPVLALFGLPEVRDKIQEPRLLRYDPFDPPEFLLAGRIAGLIASLFVVALTGALAARWSGRRAGLWAALIAATVPALVTRGGIAIVDVWSTLFVLACLVVSDRLHDPATGSIRDAALAGLLVGFATASKYPAALVGLAPLATLLLSGAPRATMLRRIALLVAASLFGAGVAMPAFWLRTAGVLHEIGRQAAFYATLPWENGYFHQAVVRMEDDLPFDFPELGWPLLLLAVGGLILALTRSELRRRVAGPVIFALALLGLQLRYGYQPFRNLLPLAPLGVAFAVLPLDLLRRRMPRARWLDFAIPALLVAALLPWAAGIATRRATLDDSRLQAARWLGEHANAGDRILVPLELSFLPRELVRVGTEAEIVPATSLSERASDARSRFLLRPRFRGETLRSEPLWYPGSRRYRLRASFGSQPLPPDEWWGVGNDLKIDVYEIDRRRKRRADSTTLIEVPDESSGIGS